MRERILAVLALCLLLPMVGGAQVSSYPATGGGSTDWAPLAPVIWDDFLSGSATSQSIGALGWETTAASVTYTAVTGRPGILTANVGAGPGYGGVAIPTPGGYPFLLSQIDTVTFWAGWTTGANAPNARAGMLSTATNAAVNASAIYFEHLAADTNWFAVTRDGASETRTDTGVAFAYATYYKLTIAHPVSGQWDFYIDGSLVASRTTGEIPAESTTTKPTFQIQTTGTALAITIDYFWMRLRAVR